MVLQTVALLMVVPAFMWLVWADDRKGVPKGRAVAAQPSTADLLALPAFLLTIVVAEALTRSTGIHDVALASSVVLGVLLSMESTVGLVRGTAATSLRFSRWTLARIRGSR